jgi:hypothetical protein
LAKGEFSAAAVEGGAATGSYQLPDASFQLKTEEKAVT